MHTYTFAHIALAVVHTLSYLLVTPVTHADETLPLKKQQQDSKTQTNLPQMETSLLSTLYPPTVAGILSVSSSVPAYSLALN